MINSVIRFSLIAVALILLQLLLFNNIQFSGFINPYVYIMIILILPVRINSWLLLILAFLTGLIIDCFSGSPGMHASATLLCGFVRPFVLRLISPHDGYDPAVELSAKNYGFRWFASYTVFIVLIHHTILFFLEVFRFDDFFRTVFRILLSSVFTAGFIILAEFIRKRE